MSRHGKIFAVVAAIAFSGALPATGNAAQSDEMMGCTVSSFCQEQLQALMQGNGAESEMMANRLGRLRQYYTGTLVRYRLASQLSLQETVIGIRAEQLDAWRAYTQAVLAMVPDREAVLAVVGAPDDLGSLPAAFARTEAVSEQLMRYADRAEVLQKAITDLRQVLTPEQLEAARLPRLPGRMN